MSLFQETPPAPPSTALSRRQFLQTTCLTSAAALFGGALLPEVYGQVAAPPLPGWFDKPMRWGQLTLVEDDPGKYDPEFWLDYFRRTHCDAVCLSAGGCVAYYPTRIPLHHRSQWMGETDPFGELVAGCRKLGLVVVARTDPHATYQDTFEAHPDWIAVDAQGQKRRHWASPEMWVTCGLGPYHFEFMTEVKREIMTRYRVDAIFINRWDGSGMCYCEHCQRHFKAATGLDLPRSSDPRDPARRQYILWRQQRLFDLWRLWDGAVRQINPEACVIPNTGGGATSSLDMRKIGELAPTLIADRQARRGLAAPWANGKNAKEFRATMGRKPIVGIFSVGLEEPYRWKDSVQSEAEIRIWALDGIANGLRPWFTKFSGTLYDRRWLRVVEDLYRWHHQVEPYLRLQTEPGAGRYHPLLAGLEDAGRIIGGVWRVEVTPTRRFASSPLTLIPSYPDLPMEKVYPRQAVTANAQVYLSSKSEIPKLKSEISNLKSEDRNPKIKGEADTPNAGSETQDSESRIVYFPWDIDRTFWEVLSVDHGRLLRNAIQWAANEVLPVSVTGPGMLDVTVWRQKRSMTVHLVNLTNPMMMKGPFREFIPLAAQHVTVQLPKGANPGQVHLLVSGKSLPVSRAGDRIELTVPPILDHEVIAIDLP